MKQANADTRPKSDFAKWLRERCREERLSYRQAAARAGLNHATIALVINGARPAAETIKKLAAAFSNDGSNQRVVLEDYLLTLCDYRSQPPEIKLNEPLAKLVDKLSHYSEAQLRLVDEFTNYIRCLNEPVITLPDGGVYPPLTMLMNYEPPADYDSEH